MELSLDQFIPKTISGFIAKISGIDDNSDKLSNLDDYVSKLEEERRKIDAFKRELPLSVLLVNDAIKRLKEEESMIRDCAIEEFMPLKKKKKKVKSFGEDEIGRVNSERDFADKKNWMSSVQLWSSNADFDLNPRREKEEEEEEEEAEEEEEEDDGCVKGQVGNYRNRGGAFVAYKAHGSSSSSSSGSQIIPSLSLMTPISSELGGSCSTTTKSNSISNPKNNTCGFRGVSGSTSVFLTQQVKLVTKPQQQQNLTLRKQRRCWSPELHRRFVDALRQLGGSQAATPKQIRDLMEVEGLTNDEVKSHLQKYRLHVRKLPNSSGGQGNGGLWKMDQQDDSQDNSNENTNISQSSSPQGPLLPNGSFSNNNHNTNNNKALSITTEAEEDEDDERSDGHSWRGGQTGNNNNRMEARVEE